MRTIISTLILFAACSGGGDGGTSDDEVLTPDAPAGSPSCKKEVYDPCTTNADCTSGNCHFYMQDGFSVCTQACTALDNSTCPVDSTGVNGTCNMRGECKPAAPNACT